MAHFIASVVFFDSITQEIVLYNKIIYMNWKIVDVYDSIKIILGGENYETK